MQAHKDFDLTPIVITPAKAGLSASGALHGRVFALLMVLVMGLLLAPVAVADAPPPPSMPQDAPQTQDAGWPDAAGQSVQVEHFGPGGSLLCWGIIPALALFALWIWALVDCLGRDFDGNDKIVWVLVILLANVIGAIIYLLIGRRQGTVRARLP